MADQIVDQVVNRRREADMGIQTLFGELDDTSSGFDERIDVPEDEVDERTMLAWEKEMLGFIRLKSPFVWT